MLNKKWCQTFMLELGGKVFDNSDPSVLWDYNFPMCVHSNKKLKLRKAKMILSINTNQLSFNFFHYKLICPQINATVNVQGKKHQTLGVLCLRKIIKDVYFMNSVGMTYLIYQLDEINLQWNFSGNYIQLKVQDAIGNYFPSQANGYVYLTFDIFEQ